MSETVVRKRRDKTSGGQTPQEYAAECDKVQQRLRNEFYERERARAGGTEPPAEE